MATSTIAALGASSLYLNVINGGSGNTKLNIDPFQIDVRFMLLIFVNRRNNEIPIVAALQIYGGTCGITPLSSNASTLTASMSDGTISVITPTDFLTAYVLSSTQATLAFVSP